MIQFRKSFSNYQTEDYETDCEWQGLKIKLSVTMQYHTFKRYWHVNYKVNYGNTHCFLIDGKSYILSRKEARKIAVEYMQKANVLDINKLTDFEKGCIKDNADKVGGFTQPSAASNEGMELTLNPIPSQNDNQNNNGSETKPSSRGI